MKSFKLHHKIIATVIALSFTFQSMTEINSHTYSNESVFIHSGPRISCLFRTQTHISYFCDDFH